MRGHENHDFWHFFQAQKWLLVVSKAAYRNICIERTTSMKQALRTEFWVPTSSDEFFMQATGFCRIMARM
eukprot:UN28119